MEFHRAYLSAGDDRKVEEMAIFCLEIDFFFELHFSIYISNNFLFTLKMRR